MISPSMLIYNFGLIQEYNGHDFNLDVAHLQVICWYLMTSLTQTDMISDRIRKAL